MLVCRLCRMPEIRVNTVLQVEPACVCVCDKESTDAFICQLDRTFILSLCGGNDVSGELPFAIVY